MTKRGKLIEQVCACGVRYQAREADIKRGWGLSCGKACAARAREKKRHQQGETQCQ